jgi:pimeloyl-ACP methyl ester carboxylesterase
LPHLDIVLTNAQGHGGSDVGQHFLGWHANAHMVHEVLQHKRQQWGDVPVIGMGHSFGGIITTLVSNLQPTSFNQLILLDPIYLPRSLTSLSNLFYHLGLMKLTPMVNKTMKRRGHWPDRDAAHASFHQRGVFRGWHDEALNAYVAHGLQEKEDGVHLVTPAVV